DIKKNVKAIVLHKIGGFAVFGTDNIIISTFVSVVAVGLYSNYYMLMDICRTFINQIFNNITHSVGNLLAKETKQKIYSVYKVTMFLNFWIYSFFSISLYIMLEPVITIWIGTNFLLEKIVVIMLLINFFISGMRRSISTVKETAGIFHEDRYAPLFEAAINLGASIYLVQHFGMMGVFMGTLISTLLIPFWVAPYLVYKKVFKKPVIYYFIRYLIYSIVGLVTLFVTYYLCGFVTMTGITGLFIKGIICIVIPNFLYVITFYKTAEYKYLRGVLRGIILKKVRKDESSSVA
ncbi:oligosaccharide flippase family protein, partial [Anaerobacillus sp. CMMVII]|nr:oligosaccharide flippase family protein [Anaerobacillus sp. CMMVII]